MDQTSLEVVKEEEHVILCVSVCVGVAWVGVVTVCNDTVTGCFDFNVSSSFYVVSWRLH